VRKLTLVLAVVSFLLAIVVFLFAGGARAIYSGLFFILIGGVLLINARRNAQK